MEEVKLANYKLKYQVELAKNNNKEAFSELIEEVKTKLYKTGMAILKNDADTCDALQETLLSAYQNIKSLEINDYFTTWIIRIMINKCYEIIRKNKRIININEKVQVSSDDNFYDRYAVESDLEWALNNIDEDLKTVTVLYYYDDFSVSEISDVLNIPEGTVKSRLSRARDRLYTIIKEKEGGING